MRARGKHTNSTYPIQGLNLEHTYRMYRANHFATIYNTISLLSNCKMFLRHCAKCSFLLLCKDLQKHQQLMVQQVNEQLDSAAMLLSAIQLYTKQVILTLFDSYMNLCSILCDSCCSKVTDAKDRVAAHQNVGRLQISKSHTQCRTQSGSYDNRLPWNPRI